MDYKKAKPKQTAILERCYIPEGSLVIKQGDSANCAYLIQSGSVSVYREINGKDVEFAKLGVGQFIGEMALLGDDLRTASVRALEDCNLIILTRQVFLEKLSNSDPTIRAVVGMLTQRLTTSNNEVAEDKASLGNLVGSVQHAYRNMLAGMKEKTQVNKFEKMIRPKLDAFLSAVESFETSH